MVNIILKNLHGEQAEEGWELKVKKAGEILEFYMHNLFFIALKGL